jgi:hypothetical protein
VSATPSASGTGHYPHLTSFLHAWFHQDFDLVGDTVPEIVAAYCASASAGDVKGVRADIARFLASASGPLNDAFDETFEPDIDPLGFEPSARRFLEVIDAQLAAPPPAR